MHPFGQPVHLWRIWYCHFMLYLVFQQVLGKLSASVLSSFVGLQHSYSLPTFSGHFGMELLEHIASVSLLWAIKYIAQD